MTKSMKLIIFASVFVLVLLLGAILFLSTKSIMENNVSGELESETSAANSEVAIKTKEDFFVYPNAYLNPAPEVPENYAAIDALVNKHSPLPSDYTPADLVSVAIPKLRDAKLRSCASDALTELHNAAKKEGLTFLATSGFRSYDLQVSLYNSYYIQDGAEAADTYSARPGFSEHQSGLVMDISYDGTLEESFGDTDIGKFIADNSHTYGYIVSYPKDKELLSGYTYEPWHLRYVGQNYATMIYNSELVMPEFIQVCEKFPFLTKIGQSTMNE